jgi:ankyrin repeat protein
MDIFEAANEGNTDMIRRLLGKGADVNAKNKDGWTALMCAVDRGHLDVARVLTNVGADVNIKHRYGYTALYIAAQNGHTKCVSLLLKTGADLRAKHSITKNTALIWASHLGHVDVVREFPWVKRNSMIALRNYLLNLED